MIEGFGVTAMRFSLVRLSEAFTLHFINSYVFESSNLAIAMESTDHYWLSIFSFLKLCNIEKPSLSGNITSNKIKS